MIQAELKGKLSECESLSVAERWEDVLTSSVFGLLRYLPQEIALQFFSKAKAINPDRTLHFDIDEIRNLKFAFWPSWSYNNHIVEPDVLIDVIDINDQIRKIVIEAKFGSGKSQTSSNNVIDPEIEESELFDEDQLVRQYKYAMREFKSCRPVLIYLTAHFVIPRFDIQETLEDLEDFNNPEIYWLGWWQLGNVMKNIQTNQRDQMIVEDLIKLLEKRQLMLFDNSWLLLNHNLASWEFRLEVQHLWWDRIWVSSIDRPWKFDKATKSWFNKHAISSFTLWRFK